MNIKNETFSAVKNKQYSSRYGNLAHLIWWGIVSWYFIRNKCCARSWSLWCLSLFKNNNVSHSMHLWKLFTVEGRHQLPGSRLGGDEVLCQRHFGVGADVTERGKMKWNVSLDTKMLVEEKGRQKRERLVLTPRPPHGPPEGPGPPLWTPLPSV